MSFDKKANTDRFHQPSRSRLATTLISVASMAFITGAVPLTVASPASAETTTRGCTVAPRFPGPFDKDRGEVLYRQRVTCTAGRTISVQLRIYEEDKGKDQLQLRYNYPNVSYSKYGSRVWSRWFQPPNTENGDEEVYQSVRFRVWRNGTWSNWTAWERTYAYTVDQ